jgi:ketosteroid isomerase-like protein
MKLLVAIALLMLLSSIALCQQRTEVLAKDSLQTEFGHIAEQWFAAYNGTDAKQLEPLYAEDAQYISGHVPGLVASGRDSLIANFQKGMNMGGHLDGLDVLSINKSCDLATILCRYNATNSGQKVSGRTLLVLKKINGLWLIVIHMTVV